MSVRVLRLRQSSEHVSLEYEADGVKRTDEQVVTFPLNARDREDLRWYMEDYLQYPLDPAPAIARRIEARMDEIGTELYRAVLERSPVWAAARDVLASTRVEIATGMEEATSIPWELMRDPESGVPLALKARAFVRSSTNAVQRPTVPETSARPVRVLLVICRPRGGADVPSRSVARRLVEGLRGNEAARLTVLRPPTFEQLAAKLRSAHATREPFHLVHFDGHGTWRETGPRKGSHGYLLFENPELDGNSELIDGPKLGSLLAETGVGTLIVNACQSAYAAPLPEPAATVDTNVHEQTRTLGSLAQEVMDAGAAGVVAMRYVVYVETAARLMTDVYQRLMLGDTLGEAVSFGRKQLHAQPLRRIGFEPVPLRDWAVPVVFEAVPLTLFPKPAATGKLVLRLDRAGAGPEVEGLPPRPDAGFFGRDETLLALDRAFDRQRIVLLHAYAGSGKTTAVAEFARWYSDTDGVSEPPVFTSFEHHKPLARALDEIGQRFGQRLEQAGVHWLAETDPQRRREIALQVLRQVPVLWIWDNVEQVAGFPKGTPSQWTPEEQRELADFLRAARETQARFLLTSRRDERGWLADLPAHIDLPPMPFLERLELARGLSEKRNRRITEVADWRPLLDFTEGNPLTISVLVGQALRDGLRTLEQIEAFVQRLRAGEAAFTDEASEGRTRSLAASLNYGFEHAFNEAERTQLALLHLFQGFVHADAFRFMGKPDEQWSIRELLGLTREHAIRLLDRAAEVGLLKAHGAVYYSIHPAVPWFLRQRFEDHNSEAQEQAARAYVEAIGSLANHYNNQYADGKRDIIGPLRAEEPNLLHARSVAIRNGWWRCLSSTMRGPRALRAHRTLGGMGSLSGRDRAALRFPRH